MTKEERETKRYQQARDAVTKPDVGYQVLLEAKVQAQDTRIAELESALLETRQLYYHDACLSINDAALFATEQMEAQQERILSIIDMYFLGFPKTHADRQHNTMLMEIKAAIEKDGNR